MYLAAVVTYATIILLVVAGKWLWKRKAIYLLSWNLPGPQSLPLLGSALSFLWHGGVLNFMTTIYGDYEYIFRIWLGTSMYIFATKSEDIEYILEKCPNRSGIVEHLIEATGGHNLFTLEGQEWRRRRRLIAPSQSRLAVSQEISTFHKDSLEAVKHLKTKIGCAPFSIAKVVRIPLTYSFFKALVNKSLDPTELESGMEMIDLGQRMVQIRMYRPWLAEYDFIWHLTKYSKRMKEIFRKFDAYLFDALKNTMKNGSDSLNIMESFLRESEENTDFKVEDAFPEMMMLVSTGVSSSRWTIAINLILLAMHPECQEKVYKELRDTFPSLDYELTDANLEKLQYLDMCMQEELRLFPSGPITVRRADHAMKIGKYDIDESAIVGVSFFHLHRDPRYWGKRSNEYNPENFSPENLPNIKPSTYFPYGAGARNCIGIHYAKMAVKVLLVNILRHYRVTTPLKYEDLKVDSIIGIHLTNECLLQVHPREQ